MPVAIYCDSFQFSGSFRNKSLNLFLTSASGSFCGVSTEWSISETLWRHSCCHGVRQVNKGCGKVDASNPGNEQFRASVIRTVVNGYYAFSTHRNDCNFQYKISLLKSTISLIVLTQHLCTVILARLANFSVGLFLQSFPCDVPIFISTFKVTHVFNHFINIDLSEPNLVTKLSRN